MLRWFYVLAHLLIEAGAARQDARIRFLKAQVDIFRCKLGGNRVISSPDDRARLLAIGQELDHHGVVVVGIVRPQTYCRWVEELRTARRSKRVGRPKIDRNLRELVIRLAKENVGSRYRRIIAELRKLRLRLAYAPDELAPPASPSILTTCVVATCTALWRGARIAARSPRNGVRLDVAPR